VWGEIPSERTIHMMPFTIYILISERVPKTYVGYTHNLDMRIKQHNNGRVRATKHFRPWKIIYTESIPSQKEAKKKELYWKSGAGRKKLKGMLGGSRLTFLK
jgi:putative endonuclease